MLVLATLAGLAVAVTLATTASQASFTTASTTQVVASVADSPVYWARIYTQSSPTGTDPDGLNGYWLRNPRPPDVMAAAGTDLSTTVDLGTFGRNFNATATRVLTITTPAVFPDPGVAQVNVTVTALADPSGQQPISNFGFDVVGSGGYSRSFTMGPGQKRQLNLALRMRGNNSGTYRPSVQIALTRAGLPSVSYEIPVTLVYDFSL
jgi:hypothetical protein